MIDLFLKYSDNQRKILTLIYNNPNISRAELVEKSNLSILTISKNILTFINDNIVITSGSLNSTGGRKANKLLINNNIAYILAMDVGAYAIKIGVLKLNGEIIYRELIENNTDSFPARTVEIETLKEKLAGIIKKYSHAKFIGIAIGISGIVDFFNKEIIFCPNLTGWNNINIQKEFGDYLNLDAIVDTSARCSALAEHRFGKGKDIKNLIYITVGYSIGAGIIINSEIFRGASGTSGELGHIKIENNGLLCTCGNQDCLELYTTLPMVINKIKKELKNYIGYSPIKNEIEDINSIKVEDILKAAKEGDKIVDRIFTETGKMLGTAIANMANLLNPELIILGGGMFEIFPQITKDTVSAIRKRSLSMAFKNLTITTSSLGYDSPIIGCALQFINKLF